MTAMRITSLILCVLIFIPIVYMVATAGEPVDTQPVDIFETTIPTEIIHETEPATEPESTTAPVETSIPETEPIIPETTEPTETEPIIPETTEPEPTTVEIDPQDLEYLACVIYQEAGGDKYCDECRRRVADVVLNRVESPRFPNTIKKVLLAEGQYGRFHWTGIVWPERAKYAGEAHAVERAYRIAREVLSGQHSELYGKGYIWQAEFVQGTDNIYCCGHYFGR